MYENVIVIIPSRIGATRLPNKPLEKIGKLTMIEHVYNAMKFCGISLNNVYVATDSKDIANVIYNTDSQAQVIMTSANCVSGTDRVYEAFTKISKDRRDVKYIINVQGDMPFLNKDIIEKVVRTIREGDCDISTPVAKVVGSKGSDTVKVVVDNEDYALYFSRSNIPYGSNEYLYHAGIYGFNCDSLQKFVKFPYGKLESIEKLEQLRALENGMRIKVCYIDLLPVSVDNYQDLYILQQRYSLV